MVRLDNLHQFRKRNITHLHRIDECGYPSGNKHESGSDSIRSPAEATAGSARVGIVEKNNLTGVTTQHNVINGIVKMDTRFARHEVRGKQLVSLSSLTPHCKSCFQ